MFRTAMIATLLMLGTAQAQDYRKARSDARELRAQAEYMHALGDMIRLQGPNTGAEDVDPGVIPPNKCGMAFEVVNAKADEARCAGR